MRNLKLSSVKAKPLLFKNVVNQVQAGDTEFLLLNNGEVYSENVIVAQNISDLDWVPIDDTVYLFDGKRIICHDVINKRQAVIEVTDNYVAHAWNPMQDSMVMVDANGFIKLIFLRTYSTEIIISKEYKLDNVEISPFINIGWGSRETQFKGSAGKNAASSSIDSENIEDKTIKIVWRDQGDMFAVSFINDGKRVFKIFSKDLDFLHESELNDFGPEISWKPDGTLIAVGNNSPQNRKILFFEKNGLYRFDLKLNSNAPVKKIGWNRLGEYLMIWQENEIGSEITLWTTSNCLWHLKQCLVFSQNKSLVHNVDWFDRSTLELFTSESKIEYSFKWVTHVSNLNDYDFINDSKNVGAVAVINGKELRVTICKNHIVPPPLCTYTIRFNEPVNQLTFGAKTNTVVVILTDYTMKIIELGREDYTEIFSSQLISKFPLSLNHFLYDDINRIIYCLEVDKYISFHKYAIDFKTKSLQVRKQETGYDHNIKMFDLLSVSESTERGFHFGTCFDNTFQICHVHDNNEESFIVSDISIQLQYYTFKSSLTSIVFVSGSYVIFSLRNNLFYLNGKLVHDTITSYIVSYGYLLLTTLENTFICVKLSEKSLTELGKRNFNDFYTRPIPNSAVLVNVVPGTRKVILQVPRGELEVINPRILTIDEINRLLANKKHLDAYMISRTDRINLNVMYDINPKRFLDDIEHYVRNIKNCDYIDDFLINLKNANIGHELYYKNCFEDDLPEQAVENKIALVTDKFIDAMKKVDSDFYLQSILTAYQCKETAEALQQALIDLYEAKKREESGIKFPVPVEDTLIYFLQLVPIEKLYDIALVLDKIDLVLWITSKSQKDPSDYVPFLNEIASMEYHYRNYKINCHVKRYKEAFQFLAKCDDVEAELIEFVNTNSLFNLIPTCLDINNKYYKSMVNLYADHLSENSRKKEAGIMYLKLGSNAHRKALKCFCENANMKEALATLSWMNCSFPYDTETIHLFKTLSMTLINKKCYKEAAHIMEEILKNYEEAISTLVIGNMWSDAYYLAVKYNRKDLVETEIRPALVNYVEVLFNILRENEQQFKTFKSRLESIRNLKKTEISAGTGFEDNEQDNDMPECVAQNFDLESLASTKASEQSKNSQKTSSSRRRQKKTARKLLSLREGSVFENIAIIRRLYDLINDTQNMVQKMVDVCTILFMIPDYFNKGIKMQSTYQSLLEFMMSSKAEIWPKHMLTPPEPATLESKVVRHNIEFLELQYRVPPPDVKQEWATLFTS